jgi:hypothetical protein
MGPKLGHDFLPVVVVGAETRSVYSRLQNFNYDRAESQKLQVTLNLALFGILCPQNRISAFDTLRVGNQLTFCFKCTTSGKNYFVDPDIVKQISLAHFDILYPTEQNYPFSDQRSKADEFLGKAL